MKTITEFHKNYESNKPKLLSILIPCFNIAKKFNVLEGLRQINDQRVELILVNDRSTDNSLKFLEKVSEEISIDVTLVDGKFYGPGAARNEALKLARGKYVWIVDADDRIFPSAVISNLPKFEKGGVHVFSFKTKYSSTGNKGQILTSSFEKPDKFGKTGSCRLCSDIIRRDIFVKNKLWYPHNIYMCEDSVLVLKLFFHIKNQELFDDVIYEYLDNEDSLSNGNVKLILSTWLAAKEIVTFVKTNKIKEKEGILKFAVRRSMLNTWVRFRHAGEKWELIRLMPKMIAASRQMGLFRHLKPFYEESNSLSSRLLKRILITSCYPISFFISDGLKSIEQEYEAYIK